MQILSTALMDTFMVVMIWGAMLFVILRIAEKIQQIYHAHVQYVNHIRVDYEWECSYCGKEYVSKKICEKHEKNCGHGDEEMEDVESSLMEKVKWWLRRVLSRLRIRGYPKKTHEVESNPDVTLDLENSLFMCAHCGDTFDDYLEAKGHASVCPEKGDEGDEAEP